MRTKLLIIISILISNFLNLSEALAQTEYSYKEHLESTLSEKLAHYDSADTTLINIKAIIDLFERSAKPNELIKLTTGISYVLTADDCSNGMPCKNPDIYGAMIFEKDAKAFISALRDRATKNPLGQNYINYFINNDHRIGGTDLFKAIYQNAKSASLTGKISTNKKEQVIVDESSVTFLRESEGWVIGLSTGKTFDYEDVFIYAWRTSFKTLPHEDILLVDTSHRILEEKEASSTPKFKDESYNQFINIKRDKTFFSEMIETIVQHQHLEIYYHGHDFFIISNDEFRNDLDIKYKGKPVWSLPSKPTELEHYLEFKSSDYHPDNDLVTFIFEYPTEGVSGEATFEKLTDDEYKLKDILIVEH